MGDSGRCPLVLVCPLDWGLGHATRCVPIIRQLETRGFSILLGGNGESISLLQQEFPQYRVVNIPGMRIRYGRGKQLWLHSLLQFPAFLMQMMNEHRAVGKICRIHQPQVIISDNRYGVWCRGRRNILLTHQLHPFMPEGLGWTRALGAAFIRWISSPFREIWIPDIPGKQNLSGELSDISQGNLQVIRYTGILSRLRGAGKPETAAIPPDIFVILSGPEPQRSIFERLVYEKFGNSPFTIYVLRGKPGTTGTAKGWQPVESPGQKGKLFFRNHLPADELAWYLHHSRLIIARSGYSTLMDLVELQRTALLVPTPGQPEQEYLGRRMAMLGIFVTSSQEKFSRLEILLPGEDDASGGKDVIVKKEGVGISMLTAEQELRRFSSAMAGHSLDRILETF
ncbi:MAG: hypothetical protein U0T82_07435 [Bacteroidales bacterium]